jgi:formyl-CoA transferase
MQNVLFRLSETPGEIKWAGPRLGEHNQEVYARLGLNADDLAELAREGVI